MGVLILLQASISIAITSVVPLLIFFVIGPFILRKEENVGPSHLVLSTLISLAAGSLLGDVFFHLIPEIFQLTGAYIRNCVLMFFGVFIFLVGERALQHYHRGHGHRHMEIRGEEAPPYMIVEAMSTTWSREDGPFDVNDEEIQLNNIEHNQGDAGNSHANEKISETNINQPNGTKKPVGILILTSDFIHNFVDGLAIGISFATSFSVGLSTSVAVFLHEIPHELGDFAILLNAGYRPMTIVFCNILTTLSSFLGVLLSLMLSSWSGSGSGLPPDTLNPIETADSFKTSILSLTVGNFLYIALTDLVPELLAESTGNTPTRMQEYRSALLQYCAFLGGAITMLLIKIYSD